VAFVREPRSFGLYQLTAADWRGAAFARETIIGGCVRASTGEEINRHNGWRVLVQKAAFDVREREDANDDGGRHQLFLLAKARDAKQSRREAAPKGEISRAGKAAVQRVGTRVRRAVDQGH
jgi:hypothetical protein